MPPLCDLYTAAAGAPNMSSSLPEPDSWRLWTKATSLLLSALEKAAASTTVLSEFSRFRMLEVSTCAKAAGCLAISREMTLTARPRVSTTSSSSASAAMKSACSLSRMAVASFSSAVPCAMLAASSSIFASDAETSPVAFPIVASSLACVAVPVWIS